MRGHATTVAALLSHGANASLRAFDGLTPLIAAARLGPGQRAEQSAIIKLLLEHQPPAASPTAAGVTWACPPLDVQAQDWFGRTALWWASAGGGSSVVAMLLSAGADPAIPDKEMGRTPLQAAQEAEMHECAALLKVGLAHDSQSGAKFIKLP
jgi:ankyrin repeat protein